MLQLNISPRTSRSIEELRELIGAADIADTLRRALTLLQLAVRNEQTGGTLILRNADSIEREVLLR